MPERLPAPPPADNQQDLLLRMLYEEQQRLRAELEGMRQKEQEGGEKKPGEEKKEGGGNKDEGGGEKKEKGGEKKSEGGDKKEKDKEEEDKKEKKPPVKERVTGWVREHPVAAVLIAVGLVLLVIGAILLWHYLDSYTDTDDAFIDGHTDPISPRISGIVTAVYVENTYFVKKGQLLVELDQRDNTVAKEQASANFAQAQAGVQAQAPNIGVTQTNVSTQVVNAEFSAASAAANAAAARERYSSAVADLRQAEANQGNAAREAERYRLLAEKEEVTREQYDQHATDATAQAELVESRRQMAAAAARAVDQAVAQLGTAVQQQKQAQQNLPRQLAEQRQMLAQRQADAVAAKAQADQAELNLEYTRIYAPEDGVIGDKQVQVATQVAPGQEMFALTQTNDVWVTANFKETQVKRMRAGQSVTIFVDALGLKFEGWVEALPGASGAVYSLLPPENATGNYVKVVQRLPVRIRMHPGQNGFQRLTPGMSVEPKVWLR